MLAPAAVWSVFANFLTLPLILAMFVVEHLCRYLVLPPDERAGIADTIRAFRAGKQRRAPRRTSDESVPLLGHASLDDIFAWRPGGPVTVRDFLADAAALAACLPPGRHLLNVCQDRYHFAVGLAAGLLSGRTSLQPSSQSAETLRQIAADCPDVCCLCDSDFASRRPAAPRLSRACSPRGLPSPRFEPRKSGQNPGHRPPTMPAIQVYTSGSTGQPLPYRKSWGSLVSNAQAEARRLDVAGHAIVGTVPAQHMYGFESTVLLALHGNAPFWSGKPFYPQDIVAALAAVPQPRLLVTTPFHLAALLANPASNCRPSTCCCRPPRRSPTNWPRRPKRVSRRR